MKSCSKSRSEYRRSLADAVSRISLVTYSGRPPDALWSLGKGRMLDTMNTAYCEVAVDRNGWWKYCALAWWLTRVKRASPR